MAEIVNKTAQHLPPTPVASLKQPADAAEVIIPTTTSIGSNGHDVGEENLSMQAGIGSAACPTLQLTMDHLGLLMRQVVQSELSDLVMRQEAVQQTYWKKELMRLYRSDSLQAIQAIAGVVAQVTFMRTIAGDHPGSFLWISSVVAFTLSIVVALLVVSERMVTPTSSDQGPASADSSSRSRRLQLEIAAITMALSLASTLLTFAASQLSGESGENIKLALFLEAPIILFLGGPLLAFTVIFLSFVFSRLSKVFG